MDTPQAENLGRAIVAIQPQQIGALPLVYPILDALHVCSSTNALVPSQADVDLGCVVLLLVLNRLLSPRPLYQVQDWMRETVLPELWGVPPEQAHDNRLGRALDRLHPYRGELWMQLVSQAIRTYDLDLNVLHWDITSIYFEGLYADSDLAHYGYSRDHRPDTKQVNLEVDISHDGYVPVLYQILAGNTADITRPQPHIEALVRFFARPELVEQGLRPLLVSDGKMVSATAVLACHRHGLHYLGPVPHRTASCAQEYHSAVGVPTALCRSIWSGPLTRYHRLSDGYISSTRRISASGAFTT